MENIDVHVKLLQPECSECIVHLNQTNQLSTLKDIILKWNIIYIVCNNPYYK